MLGFNEIIIIQLTKVNSLNREVLHKGKIYPDGNLNFSPYISIAVQLDP